MIAEQPSPVSEEHRKTIKGYVFAQKIGRGNYGSVYKATKDGVTYAIKAIDRSSFSGSSYRQNLMKRLLATEIKVMKRINNPYVVKCYEDFRTNNRIYLVMEYCDEPNLQELIKRGEVSNREAVTILKQILSGVAVFLQKYLQALHRLPVIHRDLKPENILRRQGRYKIGDLGFARVLEHNNSIVYTSLGTPMYMAPEIIKQQPYNLKVDIWSLGVIFYQLLFRRLPYNYRSNNNQHMRKVMDETEVSYEGVNVPESSLDFIRCCLKADPKERMGWTELKSHKIFKENQLYISGDMLEEPDIKILPIPSKNDVDGDEFSCLEKEELQSAYEQENTYVVPCVKQEEVAKPPKLEKPAIQPPKAEEETKTLSNAVPGELNSPQSANGIHIQIPVVSTEEALQKSMDIIHGQQALKSLFARHSSHINYEKNRLLLLMEYVVNIKDRIAEKIFNDSLKLTQLRLLVCTRCMKKIELLNDILERKKNVLNFDRFEEYIETEQFSKLSVENKYLGDHIKQTHKIISEHLEELRNTFKHQFLAFFGNRQEQGRKEMYLSGQQDKDYDINGHTDFTETLIQKVCHKFTDRDIIKPSFHMYMFVWTARRYRQLALTTENYENTRKEVDAMFQRVNELERSFEDWRKKIDEIALEIGSTK